MFHKVSSPCSTLGKGNPEGCCRMSRAVCLGLSFAVDVGKCKVRYRGSGYHLVVYHLLLWMKTFNLTKRCYQVCFVSGVFSWWDWEFWLWWHCRNYLHLRKMWVCKNKCFSNYVKCQWLWNSGVKLFTIDTSFNSIAFVKYNLCESGI